MQFSSNSRKLLLQKGVFSEVTPAMSQWGTISTLHPMEELTPPSTSPCGHATCKAPVRLALGWGSRTAAEAQGPVCKPSGRSLHLGERGDRNRVSTRSQLIRLSAQRRGLYLRKPLDTGLRTKTSVQCAHPTRTRVIRLPALSRSPWSSVTQLMAQQPILPIR